MVIGIGGTLGRILLSPDEHGAAVGGINAGDLRDQGGLTRAVLADQAANLTFFQRKINVYIGVGWAKALVQAANFKDVLTHFTTSFVPRWPMTPNTMTKAPRNTSCRVPEGMPKKVMMLNTA